MPPTNHIDKRITTILMENPKTIKIVNRLSGLTGIKYPKTCKNYTNFYETPKYNISQKLKFSG